MQPELKYLDALDDTSTRIEPALTIDDVECHAWDESCDVLVVGSGLSGTSATLRASEDRALSIINIDRGLGGGASALSGGVVYMGGGTKVQKELGIEDTPENMAAYLQLEANGVVRPETILRFAYASTRFQPWLEGHGARFGGPLTTAKTSYPRHEFLYYSGNERTIAGKAVATPAARGHRTKPPEGKKATALSGADLMRPLVASMEQQPNVRFFRQSRAQRLIVDSTGAVVGVEVLRILDAKAARKHARMYRLGNKTMLGMLGLLGPIRRKVSEIEQRFAVSVHIRARKGVVLAAGGFAFNRALLGQLAPAYMKTVPLGTIADDGSGLKLGWTAGAAADRLDTVSAWRFLYPPASWTKAIAIGPDAKRLVNEELYASYVGEAIYTRAGGHGWLILDQKLQSKVEKEVKSKDLLMFQRLYLGATQKRNTVSAPSIRELAELIGVPPSVLDATVESHNQDIGAGRPDALGKSEELRVAQTQGPFYATDIGANRKLVPVPALTMGGLCVDEVTGAVLNKQGAAIPGLYAAGRTAVGVCSNYYISGLSLGDCVFSGWRAAETLKGNGGATALAPEVMPAFENAH